MKVRRLPRSAEHPYATMKALLPLSLTLLLGAASLGATNLDGVGAEAARYESGQPATALRKLDDALARSSDDPELRQQLETALVEMLKPESTQEAKLFACQRLSVIGSETSLPSLAALLRAEETVGMACLALANYPHQEADRVLREALTDLEGNARVQVIATLGTRRDRESSRVLRRIALSSDSAEAEAAILALGRISDRTARRTLARLRGRAPESLTARLDEATLIEAEVLVSEGEVEQASELYEALLAPSHAREVRAGALDALLRMEPGRAEERIHRLLRGDDPSLEPTEALRPVAIAAIGRLGSATSGLVFAGELDRLSPFEQVLMVEALADLGSACPRAALAAQLRSSSAEVRLAVIRAFAGMSEPSDLKVFAQALAAAQTTDERQEAETALVRLPGGAATDQALLAQLTAAPPAARPSLLNALARRGYANAIPALFEAAKNSDPNIARAGLQGLGRLAGPAELPALLDLYASLSPGSVKDDAQGAIARILGRMPDATGRSQAVSAKLEAASTSAERLALIGILPLAGGTPALEAARAAAASEDAAIRDAGVRALALWNEADVVDDLLQIVQDPPAPAHRTLALRGLVRLAREENTSPNDTLVAHYRRLTELAASETDRQLILGALGGCPHPGALELALEQRSDEAVRAEADQAVRRIAEAIKGSHRELAEEALRALSQ
jgi:HEAT repeat protein